VVREGVPQDIDDGLLGFLVDFADEIVLAFAVYRQAVQVLAAVIDDFSGGARGLFLCCIGCMIFQRALNSGRILP
jgi:hypothetical protein